MTKRRRNNTSKSTAREKASSDASQLDLNLKDIKKAHEDVDTQSFTEDDLIPSGITMFNLACSGHASGAYKKGSINTTCGTSDSGKTVKAMSVLAATAANKKFDKYDFGYEQRGSERQF